MDRMLTSFLWRRSEIDHQVDRTGDPDSYVERPAPAIQEDCNARREKLKPCRELRRSEFPSLDFREHFPTEAFANFQFLAGWLTQSWHRI